MPLRMPPFGARPSRYAAFALSITLFSLSVGCFAAFASALFSGLSGLEARAGHTSHHQILSFESDLPVQYSLTILDRHHILLKLHHVQFTKNLLNADGTLNITPGGAVESARLQAADRKTGKSDVQDILLTGTNLGSKRIEVLGGTPVEESPLSPPLSSVAKSQPSPNVTLKAPTVQVATRVSPRPPSGPRIETTNATPAPEKKPLQIVAITPVSRQTSSSQHTSAPLRENAPASFRLNPAPAAANGYQPDSLPSPSNQTPWYQGHSSARQNHPSIQEESDSTIVDENTSNSTSSAASEPEIQQALPRYHGGAAPIQAITTDTHGNPVRLTPKKTDMVELSIGTTPQNSSSRVYNTLFQAEPSPAEAVNQRIADAVQAYRKQQYANALQAVENAIQLDPENAELYAALGEIQLKLNHVDAASQAYQKARLLNEHTGNQTQYNQRYAEILTLNGQRNEAIGLLKQLLATQPHNAKLAYMLGTLYEELGQSREALPYLQEAAQAQGNSADIQYNLGLAYELTGDTTKARQHYQLALRLSPAAKDTQSALQRLGPQAPERRR